MFHHATYYPHLRTSAFLVAFGLIGPGLGFGEAPNALPAVPGFTSPVRIHVRAAAVTRIHTVVDPGRRPGDETREIRHITLRITDAVGLDQLPADYQELFEQPVVAEVGLHRPHPLIQTLARHKIPLTRFVRGSLTFQGELLVRPVSRTISEVTVTSDTVYLKGSRGSFVGRRSSAAREAHLTATFTQLFQAP